MQRISKDDLASLIDVGRLRNLVADRVDGFPSFLKKEEVSDTKNIGQIIKVTLIVVGVLAAIAGAAYAIYRFMTPDYDDEFDDDFEDAFDDDEEDLFADMDDDDIDAED